MPCVLPVLSMKLLAVVGHGGGDRRVVRAGFVATAAGILFSFLVLAGGADRPEGDRRRRSAGACSSSSRGS